jgi:hypothetical protein
MQRGRLWGCLLLSVSCSADAPAPDANDDTAGDTDTDTDGTDGRSELCIALGERCHDEVVTEPRLSDPVFVAPSSALPPEVVSQRAHNNLDVQWHDGRLFFAFRTGPNHFASGDTVMYVVSTQDFATWRYETEVALGTDVREPQFLSLDGRLLFYFAVLGDSPLSFTPMGSRIMEFIGPGQWTEPALVFQDDFLPWRIKDYDGTVYVAGYLGGEAAYDPEADPIRVQVLTTSNGTDWTPAFGGDGTVLEGGSSETDFVFQDDGSLIGVSRNEAGDELGYGMKICKAPAGALADWECVADPRKYDSPLLFRHGSTIYLIGRRNVSDTGWYDLMQSDQANADTYWDYQLDYWMKPKRCALWTVDPQSLQVEHVLDLPSRGDTCFPELLSVSETQYLVFNYTSPLDGPDLSWQDGQIGNTLIYYTVLTLPPPA